MTAFNPHRVVVADTDPAAALTLDRDQDGHPFTLASAAAYCAMLNAERRPASRTWQVFRLIPADAGRYLVEEFAQDLASGRERIARRFTEQAASPHAAFDQAAERAGGFVFGSGELEELDPGYRWAASDGSSVCYEVRHLDAS